MSIKNVTLLLSLGALGACTPYSESFDCPPGKGVGCHSLSAVNHMVEEGELPLESDSFEKVPLESGPLKNGPVERNRNPASLSSPLIEASNAPLPLIKKQAPYKVPPPASHLKVWVAAYEDEEGNYHSPSFIYLAHQSSSSER